MNSNFIRVKKHEVVAAKNELVASLADVAASVRRMRASEASGAYIDPSSSDTLLKNCTLSETKSQDISSKLLLLLGELISISGVVGGNVGPDVASAIGLPSVRVRAGNGPSSQAASTGAMGTNAPNSTRTTTTEVESSTAVSSTLTTSRSGTSVDHARIANVLIRLVTCDLAARYILWNSGKSVNGITSMLAYTEPAVWMLRGIVNPATIMVLNVALSTAQTYGDEASPSSGSRSVLEAYRRSIAKQSSNPAGKDADEGGKLLELSKLLEEEIESNDVAATSSNSNSGVKNGGFRGEGMGIDDNMLADLDGLGDSPDEKTEADNGLNGDSILRECVSQVIDTLVDSLGQSVQGVMNPNGGVLGISSSSNSSSNVTLTRAFAWSIQKLIEGGVFKRTLMASFLDLYGAQGQNSKTVMGPWKWMSTKKESNGAEEKMENGTDDDDDDDMFASEPTPSSSAKSTGHETESLISLILECCILLSSKTNLSKEISSYVEREMTVKTPNLSVLLGSKIASQLLAMVGGVEQLVRIPACNILVIGANGGSGGSGAQGTNGSGNGSDLGLSRTVQDKHGGIIWASDLIKNLPLDIRRKMARTLSAKVALAARFDLSCESERKRVQLMASVNNNSGNGGDVNSLMGTHGQKLRDDVSKQIDLALAPPPSKKTKALPAPDEPRKKRRGGQRVRKWKEKNNLALSQQIKNSRIKMSDNSTADYDAGVEFDQEI